MKNLSKNISWLFALLILVVCVLVLPDCTDRSASEEHSFDNYLQSNKEKARVLLQKFHAQMFDCQNYSSILTRPVVMDSTIVSLSKYNGSYFLKALVKSDCNKKVYASLKCSKEIFNQYKNAKECRAFIVSSIQRINEANPVSEVDSIDGRVKIFGSGNSTILTGECLALTEIPEYSHIY
jgi:hypothetical protein